MAAESAAMRRLCHDFEQLQGRGHSQISVKPSSESRLHWHFLLHNFPEASACKGGMYHGKLSFPGQYPFSAPRLMMLTPNGKLPINKWLCMNAAGPHPDIGNPTWTVESLLQWLLSFMADEHSHGFDSSGPMNQQIFAAASKAFNLGNVEFQNHFPELALTNLQEPTLGCVHEPKLPKVEKEGATICNPDVVVKPADASMGAHASWHRRQQTLPGVQEQSAAICNLGVVGKQAEASIGARASCQQRRQALQGVKEAEAAFNPDIVGKPAEASADVSSSWRQRRQQRLPPPPPPQSSPASVKPPRTMKLATATGGKVFVVPEGHVIVEPALDLCEAGPVSSVEVDCESFVREKAKEECWICRKDGSLEPLVQPCACRGSMSGVHVCCMEAWVNHHRSNAMGAKTPQCSVCGQVYRGTEWRPGLAGFVRHICIDFLQQAIRTGMLMGGTVSFWLGAQENWVATRVRVPLLVVAAIFILCKALVLVVSLPWDRPPPQNRCCRWFHVDGKQAVAVRIAELCSTLVMAAIWYFQGELKLYYFAFLCFLTMVPLFSTLIRQGSEAFTIPGVRLMGLVLLSPIFPLAFFVHRAWQEPWRIVDPTHALIHLFVPIITVPLCLLSDSNAPVLIVWTVHCLVLFVGIADKFAVNKAAWKEGRLWWILMQFSLLSAYVANLLNSFTRGFFIEQSEFIVVCVSLVWLTLCCTLSISVNWGLCVQHYHTWQGRNGNFTFSATAVPPNNAEAPAASTWGSATRTAGIYFYGHDNCKLSSNTVRCWAATILEAKTAFHHNNHYELSRGTSKSSSHAHRKSTAVSSASDGDLRKLGNSVNSKSVSGHRIVTAEI